MNGWLLYRNWRGHERQIKVRDCKDPSTIVDALSEVLGSPVTWKSA